MTAATSSSDRYGEARAALAQYAAHDLADAPVVRRLAEALRALITPPATDAIRDREHAERIADHVFSQIDLGDGIRRTPVNFADAIRSGWIGAETISHVVTVAALRGLTEARA